MDCLWWCSDRVRSRSLRHQRTLDGFVRNTSDRKHQSHREPERVNVFKRIVEFLIGNGKVWEDLTIWTILLVFEIVSSLGRFLVLLGTLTLLQFSNHFLLNLRDFKGLNKIQKNEDVNTIISRMKRKCYRNHSTISVTNTTNKYILYIHGKVIVKIRICIYQVYNEYLTANCI